MCVVSLCYTDADLVIRVTDGGGLPAGLGTGGIAAAGTGHGIIGMRERVHLCGGTFDAGPLPDGGFEVRAALPLPLPASPRRRRRRGQRSDAARATGAAAERRPPARPALGPAGECARRQARPPGTRRRGGRQQGMTISVAVADDQALVRAGFCGIIAATPGLGVVGEAANGAEAVAAARSARPDVLLMDVRMPVLDGIEATGQITSAAESAGVRVIILTTFDLDEYVFGALRAGASGFLLKDTLPEDLITAIRVVAAGEALLAPSVTRRLISEFARTPALGLPGAVAPGLPAHPGTGRRPRRRSGAGGVPSARAGPRGRVTELLTDRECEVLRLVAAGMSNGEIADHLRISPATAKTHVAHLLTKLDARDRVQLVIIAYQAGLVTRTRHAPERASRKGRLRRLRASARRRCSRPCRRRPRRAGVMPPGLSTGLARRPPR